MPLKNGIKYNVPNILRALDKAEDDESAIRYFNMLLCMYISPLLFAGSIVNLVLRYFILHRSLWITLMDSAVFLVFGAVFELLLRIKINLRLSTHLISALYNIFFIYIVVRFYDLIGPAVWTFGFIFVLMSMAHVCRVMLTYNALTMLGTGIYVTFFTPPLYGMSIHYYVVQFIFFALLFAVSLSIFNINRAQLKKIKFHVKELKRQIAKRKETEAANIRLALYDQLTGLLNRTLFNERLTEVLSAKGGTKPLCVFFIDLDMFKMINDTLGHTSGDELLVQVGKRLSGIFRKSETIARIGGDEFLILAENVASEAAASKLANQILQALRKPYTIEYHQINITCSIGISRFPKDGGDAETLIKHADLAMYKAKDDGKNRFAFYSEKLKLTVQKEMDMAIALQNALLRDELELYYQPQVDGVTKDVTGIEALIRWNHPKLGTLLPKDFIPVAEKTGLIVPIGEWALKTACMQNKLWQNEGVAFVPVAVNLASVQLQNHNLTEFISSILNETGLEPRYLELEITERMLIKEIAVIKDELDKLKALGVRIAIDDFGMGYSSIHYLKELPVDRIKIPINFIRGIEQDIKDESIITVILALAENLNLDVVAEGVETKTQLEFLKNRLCNNIQGFYFSRPLKAHQVEQYCKSGLKQANKRTLNLAHS